jgi:hypothetical protein
MVEAEGNYLPAKLAKADQVTGVVDRADPELIDCRPFLAWPGAIHAYRLIDVLEDKDIDVQIALTPGVWRRLVVLYPAIGKPGDTTVLGLKPVSHDHGDWYYPGLTAITSLADGEERRLYVCSNDGQFAAAATVDGKETGPVKIQLKPTGTLTGRLLDQNGKPVRGVSFQLRFDDGADRPGVIAHGGFIHRLSTPAEEQRHRRTKGFSIDKVEYSASVEKTDEQGRFRLEGVLPDVAFELRVQMLSEPGPKGQRHITGMVKVAHTLVKPGDTKDLGELRVSWQ